MLLRWQWGRGAAGFWFLSELDPAPSFVPPLAALGSEFGDMLRVPQHVLLTCPTPCPAWGGARGWAVCHGQGHPAWAPLRGPEGAGTCASPGRLSLSHHCPQARMWLPVPDLCQALLKPPGEVGTVKAPVIAEPFCVSSGRQWHGLPAWSLPQILVRAAPRRSPCTP